MQFLSLYPPTFLLPMLLVQLEITYSTTICDALVRLVPVPNAGILPFSLLLDTSLHSKSLKHTLGNSKFGTPAGHGCDEWETVKPVRYGRSYTNLLTSFEWHWGQYMTLERFLQVGCCWKLCNIYANPHLSMQAIFSTSQPYTRCTVNNNAWLLKSLILQVEVHMGLTE